MPAAYIPVLIFALLVLSFPVISLIVFKFIRPESRVGDAKFLPYECGIPPESNARGRYSARFYIVAMLFVIFDVETAAFYPWAVKLKTLGLFGFFEMLTFIVVLGIGYAYVWKKGGFSWR